MTSYQFIVINANNERKQLIQNQFNQLNKNVSVYYLEASLPSNSKNYLNGVTEDLLKTNNININIERILKDSCCFHSHIRALEYASKSNCDFSIIIEDDVAFYKNNFLEIINDIICRWNEYEGHKMIAIGYIPTANYGVYSQENSYYNKLKFDNIIIHSHIINVGMQGYIVKNNDIPYLDFLLQPTLIELYNKLNSDEFINIIKNNYGVGQKYLLNFKFSPVDVYINVLYKQISTFPPLLIEQNIGSLLGHDNQKNYWDVYFKGYESEKEKYNIN